MKKILRQSYLSYKAMYSFMTPQMYIIMMIINPTLQVIFLSLMVKFAYGTDNIAPWIIGNAFLLISGNSVFVVGNLLRNERNMGTLKYTLGAPANKFSTFLTRTLFHFIDIIVTIILGFIIGIVFFNFQIRDINIFRLTIAIIVGGTSGLAFGTVIGSLVMITTEVHLLLNTASQILAIFTGSLIYVSKLPKSVRWISEIVPLKKTLEASRLLLTNHQENFYPLIGKELIHTIIMFILGYILFIFCYNKTRKGAKIDLY